MTGSDAWASDMAASDGRPGDGAQDTRGASQAGDRHGEGVELKQLKGSRGDRGGAIYVPGESRWMDSSCERRQGEEGNSTPKAVVDGSMGMGMGRGG